MERLKSWLGLSTKKPPLTTLAKPNLSRLKPYGDHIDDGAMQLSFTLPVPCNDKAREAARLYAEKLGLKDVHVAHTEAMETQFTFFVVYGFSKHTLDFSAIHVPKPKYQIRSLGEIDELIAQEVKRKLVVVGATTGSDAHTVGLDAIMNMKGYKGDYGLERYEGIKAYNLRSQVDNRELIAKAAQFQADAILVSQLVTQQNQHLKNLKELAQLVKKERNLRHPILVAGGPRMDHDAAKKVGFDAGFGPGTLPSEVASFIVEEFLKRHKKHG